MSEIIEITRKVLAGSAGTEDCFKGGEHMICLPGGYQKYDLPLNNEPVRVFIEVHIKDIPKVNFSLFHCFIS